MTAKQMPAQSMGDIETRCKNLSAARDLLGARVMLLNDEYEQIKRRAMPLIKSALNAAKAAEAELKAVIEANPDHFKQPRTVIFHGIKVGFQKGKGATVIDNPEQTIKLIRKLLPDQAELLIQTKEAVIKEALGQLDVRTLKSLGVRVEKSSDKVVLKAVHGELDKMLNALLKAEEPDDDASEDAGP